jgi:prepilin-type N-terminal cleavage/methylation domain-containing protein
MWSGIMSTLRLRRLRGVSLIEVMFAVALMGVTALGVIAAQLWIAREARAAALREHAVLVADAVAEAARAPVVGDVGLQQWKARAASLLPQGDATISESGGGVSFARVTWSAVSNLPASVVAVDKPASCGDAALPAGVACIAMAFVQ